MLSIIARQLYDDENERKRHAEAILYISLHMDIPQEKVGRLYEIVLRRYKAQARVNDFLFLLAGKRVEQLIQKWSSRHFKKRND